MSLKATKSEVPSELREKIAAFDKAFSDVEGKFEPLLKVPQAELNARLNTLDKAKLDLVAAYSLNSLFWMYLNVCGANPKDHGIKQELDRIRGYMNRVKEIQDREKAPSLNVKAAKRFVKSALWEAAQKGIAENQDTATPSTSTADGPPQQSSKGGKRKSDEMAKDVQAPSSSKKKKKRNR